MGIIITPQEEINKYFEAPEINQSTLKDLQGGLGGFLASIEKKKKHKEENKPQPDYFLIGGAVDTILTGEKGEFEKQYYVSSLSKTPSEVETAIIESVYQELVAEEIDLNTIEFNACASLIIPAADEQNWQMRWKDETRAKKIIEAGEEYFEDLKKSTGKLIISTEMNDKIHFIVNSLRFNFRTKKYFDRELQKSQDNIDFYYQLPMYFDYKGVKCKALMDLVVVHKNDKGEIIKIEPIDLKTMSGDTLQFVSKMRQHRYDIQAAWYILGLSTHFNVPSNIIEPFKFIVESTTNMGTPLVYEITRQTEFHGVHGTPDSYFESTGGKTLFYPATKGYESLMEDYIYYSETGFKEDKITEGKNILTIDWTKGIVK